MNCEERKESEEEKERARSCLSNERLRDVESAGEKEEERALGEEKARVYGAHIIKAIRRSQIRYSTSYITNMIIRGRQPEGGLAFVWPARVSGYEAG